PLIARQIPREDWNENRTNCAFTDETAKQVGNAIGDGGCVGSGSCSAKKRNPGVSDIPQSAAQYRGGADDGCGPEQVSVLFHDSCTTVAAAYESANELSAG